MATWYTDPKDGRVLQSDADKWNCWAEHFQEVVNCQIYIYVIPIEDLPIVTPHSSSVTTLSDYDLSSPFSEEEIISVISELRSGKDPGPAGVSLEMLSLGGESILNTIWATESAPGNWQSQILVPLHKKGTRTSCDNYRGIALLSVPGKVFAKPS